VKETPRTRLTVFRLMLAVAIAAIVCYSVANWSGSRRERLLEIANRHARLGAEYRRNANGHDGMLWTASWHDHMRREFERAASQPWPTVPSSMPFPPKGWRPPAIDNATRK
jgi:hypothetical protein